ncbi:MAG: hypothetical protein GQ574_07495 [Crocinitomix sp.]|nr:hypothetical protein [Crocinitomix sp.]
MFAFEIHILIVILPLLLSNVIHMLVVKQNFLSSLAQPIWQVGLGANKTWRGFLIVPILNAFFFWLIISIGNIAILNPVLIGFLLGLAYLLFELPNSYIKRRAGIQAGSTGNKYGLFVTLIDKMDSAFGVVLVYYVMGHIMLVSAIVLFFLASLTHLTISYLLMIFKIKKSL